MESSITLLNPSEWNTTTRFKTMFVSKRRLRPNPSFNFGISDLCSTSVYRIMMKLEMIGFYKYKINKEDGKYYEHSIETPTDEQLKPAYVEHHMGEQYGDFWTSQPVMFDQLFLTTEENILSDSFRVETRRAYKMSLVINDGAGNILREFHDPLLTFVTVYQQNKKRFGDKLEQPEAKRLKKSNPVKVIRRKRNNGERRKKEVLQWSMLTTCKAVQDQIGNKENKDSKSGGCDQRTTRSEWMNNSVNKLNPSDRDFFSEFF